ncbi:rhamnogalacturonan acetylesterase [Paenibacillus wulumuqiensis]|uniref:rhamnogalacturonan acetylesterase n=1 Tax=Paenibacillus wulumuqiensis TaxID=1567107 RepID=UPI000697E2DF|nr:rhamnogalacturonan acetylesterase [Paenibacillus wulumuqiensis]
MRTIHWNSVNRRLGPAALLGIMIVSLWFMVGASSGTSAGHQQPVVYLAGDSTVQTYTDAQRPQAGWGQMIGRYFDQGVTFSNHAISGRSTRTFIEQGRLDDILSEIQPGDYLLIQFGHNDANQAKPDRYTPVGDYKRYLHKYVQGARDHGAAPVLITPMGTRTIDKTSGRFQLSFPEYVQAMKQVAAETGTPLLDLSASSVAYYNSIGAEATKQLFLYTAPGQYAAFAAGSADDVHFQEYGADRIARLVADGIGALNLPLSAHVVQ